MSLEEKGEKFLVIGWGKLWSVQPDAEAAERELATLNGSGAEPFCFPVTVWTTDHVTDIYGKPISDGAQ